MPGSELVEIVPRKNPGRMQIVKNELHRIVAGGLDPGDPAVPFTANCQALFRPVALHLRAWTHDPQILGRKIKTLALLKPDAERAAAVLQPDFFWPMFLALLHRSDRVAHPQIPRAASQALLIKLCTTFAWNFHSRNGIDGRMSICVPTHQTGALPRAARPQAPLIDPFGRRITYLRLSVTDRCDMRCVYCMSEDMNFLPKRDLLTFEELDRLTTAFVMRGVRKLRITGGEPLVRRDIMHLFQSLSRHIDSGALAEVTLTTNGSLLARYAKDLAAAGVRRINISLDTLDAAKYSAITRWGDHAKTMAGIDAAQEAGLAVKINMVALKGVNEDEIVPMLEWAHGRGADLSLIEVMPLGAIEPGRADQYLPLNIVKQRLRDRFTLRELDYRTGGPARYVHVEETGGRLGFITPLTHNFCESCNRVRVTCTGTLYMCLGQEDAADLRTPLRASHSDELLHHVLDAAIARKPKGHDFIIDGEHSKPAVSRHMSATGG